LVVVDCRHVGRIAGTRFEFPRRGELNAILNGEVAMRHESRFDEFRSWKLTMSTTSHTIFADIAGCPSVRATLTPSRLTLASSFGLSGPSSDAAEHHYRVQEA
jgi:hypothetical protein